jgi:hypothetical protein
MFIPTISFMFLSIKEVIFLGIKIFDILLCIHEENDLCTVQEINLII